MSRGDTAEHKRSGLNNRTVFSPALEARSPRSRCLQGGFLLRDPGEPLSHSLKLPAVCWHLWGPLAERWVTPISASVPTDLSLCAGLRSNSALFTRTPRDLARSPCPNHTCRGLTWPGAGAEAAAWLPGRDTVPSTTCVFRGGFSSFHPCEGSEKHLPGCPTGTSRASCGAGTVSTQPDLRGDIHRGPGFEGAFLLLLALGGPWALSPALGPVGFAG